MVKRVKNIWRMPPDQPPPVPRELDPQVKQAMDDAGIRFEDVTIPWRVKK